jgi:preprotein translocase subunit SecY
MFLMWLGEQITSRGIGNGISLIIMAGHRLPASARARQCVRRRPHRLDVALADLRGMLVLVRRH